MFRTTNASTAQRVLIFFVALSELFFAEGCGASIREGTVLQMILPDLLAVIRDYWLYHKKFQERGILKDSTDGYFRAKCKLNQELLYNPHGLALDGQGHIFCSDQLYDNVHMFYCSGIFIRSFCDPGSEPGQLLEPAGLTFDIYGNLLVTERKNHRVQIFDHIMQHKSFIGSFGISDDLSIQDAFLNDPNDVAVDNRGNVVVSDHGNSRLQVFSSSGAWLRSIRSPDLQMTPIALTVDLSNNIFVCDASKKCIQLYNQDGQLMSSFNHHIVDPRAILLEKNGNLVVVAQGRYHRGFDVFSPTGEFLRSAGTFNGAYTPRNNVLSVALTKDGTIFVAEGFGYPDASPNVIQILE